MEPTVEKIFDDLNRIEELMSDIHLKRRKGQNFAEDKKELSDILAYAVCEIRHKYELTSCFYVLSEQKAEDKYKEEYWND